jgi:hypothetical protein
MTPDELAKLVDDICDLIEDEQDELSPSDRKKLLSSLRTEMDAKWGDE